MKAAEKLIGVLESVQEHWQENGIFNSFTVDEAIRFNRWVEHQRRMA